MMMQLSANLGNQQPWQRQRRPPQNRRCCAARSMPPLGSAGAGAMWGAGGVVGPAPAPFLTAAAAAATVAAVAATVSAAAAATKPAADAASSTTATTAAEMMASFRHTATLAGGARVTVEPLREEQIGPCAELLTDAFVSTSSRVAPYGRFLRRRIEEYLKEHIRLPPKALVLACVVDATSSDNDGSSSSSSSSSSNSDSTTSSSTTTSSSSSSSSRKQLLVGTAEVSFDRSTRSTYLTLNAPPRCAYACNTAVAPAWRRRGAARALMAAVEAVAAAAGERECYLHLRMRDDAGPGQLYRSLGYEEAAADSWLLGVIGYERRWLMRKALDGGSSGSGGSGGGGNAAAAS